MQKTVTPVSLSLPVSPDLGFRFFLVFAILACQWSTKAMVFVMWACIGRDLLAPRACGSKGALEMGKRNQAEIAVFSPDLGEWGRLCEIMDQLKPEPHLGLMKLERVKIVEHEGTTPWIRLKGLTEPDVQCWDRGKKVNDGDPPRLWGTKWDVIPQGLSSVLAENVEIVGEGVRAVMNLGLDSIFPGFHPGGNAIVDRVEERFGLEQKALRA
nr:chalcone synthase [Ipomoea batatas]